MLFNVNEKFKLSPNFLKQYENIQPNWGGALGYVTYKRTYARILNSETNRTEEWNETCRRVVEGCFTVQLNHCKNLKLPWNAHKAQKSAQEMYKLMFNFKFLPPGRGLWAMGADFIYEKGSAALNNCAFISTEQINIQFSEPFCFLMDCSLLGVGCGFDTNGAGKIEIKQPKILEYCHTVEDSREGWVELVRVFLDAYVGDGGIPKNVDYSKIRPNGSPIKTFGGTAPGPDPLIQCIKEIQEILNLRIGEKIRSTDIVDIMNIVGKCVISGGIRRTAELALGNYDDIDYLKLKDPTINGEYLNKWRWASNNSVFCKEGMDYTNLAKQTAINGEPGYFWLENARKYGRIKDGVNWIDEAVMGCNPCGEQSLESASICNLVETFPSHHENLEEFKRTLKYAYLYAKTVTLIPTHMEKTNQIMLRNRRIGLSQSGITEAIYKFGRRNYLNMCDEGYKYIESLDKVYSRWLCITNSIKRTSVKPSGSISLLPGVTPGIHYPHSEYYLRAIRLSKGSNLISILENSGYRMEESLQKDNSIVCYFPVKSKNFDRSKKDVSIWEQVQNVVDLQYIWSDNQVSATVSFKEEEVKEIPRILEIYEDRLKSISFLPLKDHKYKQAPYIEINKEEYDKYYSQIKELDFDDLNTNELQEKFCDGESCTI